MTGPDPATAAAEADQLVGRDPKRAQRVAQEAIAAARSAGVGLPPCGVGLVITDLRSGCGLR